MTLSLLCSPPGHIALPPSGADAGDDLIQLCIAYLSSNQLVIFAMRSDPKPMDAARDGQAERTVVLTDSDAVKSTLSNSLEVQRWVSRISLELREVSVGYALNFRRQCVEALPKPLRCRVRECQSCLVEPAR